MNDDFMTFLAKWKATKDTRQQLQDIYLVLGVAIVVLSGLVTFLNADLGYTMVMAGLILLGAFLVNAVAWHLIASAFLANIKKPRRK